MLARMQSSPVPLAHNAAAPPDYVARERTCSTRETTRESKAADADGCSYQRMMSRDQ